VDDRSIPGDLRDFYFRGLFNITQRAGGTDSAQHALPAFFSLVLRLGVKQAKYGLLGHHCLRYVINVKAA